MQGSPTADRAADNRRPSEKSARRSRASILPPAAISEHSIHLAGVEIPYSAKAATLALRDARGKTLADIFYVAYVRGPLDPKRPINFVFNGGPGAASAYLHLGAIGPESWRRAQGAKCSAPLLGSLPMTRAGSTSPTSFSSIPVGTGYSRARDGKDESDYFGVEQDTRRSPISSGFTSPMQDGWSSPVFLTGESYGGFRVATITRALQKTGAISPSGLILISPALEFSLLSGEDFDPLPWALGPTLLDRRQSRKQRRRGTRGARGELKETERYALSDYLVALPLAPEGANAASDKVARLTGLPIESVRRNFARIPPRSSSRSSIAPTARS